MTREETIAQLKQEIAELTAEKEVENLQRQVDSLKTFPRCSQNEDDLKQARVRCVPLGVWHFIAAPVASWVYSIKTNNYIPSLVGTGIALVGFPLAVIDLGITAAVGAPVAAATLHITNTLEKRRKLNICMPEEADKMLYRR